MLPDNSLKSCDENQSDEKIVNEYYSISNRSRASLKDEGDMDHLPNIASTLMQERENWENRYMVHNPAIQVSNYSRDILLKYYHSSRERRGFVYHLSASVIKFIRELSYQHENIHSQQRSAKKARKTKGTRSKIVSESNNTDHQRTSLFMQELIENEGPLWVQSEDNRTNTNLLNVDPNNVRDSLPDNLDFQPSHLCIFIKPQVSLTSDIDSKSTVIFTAFKAELKTFSVVDHNIPEDPVNSLVLHQSYAVLESLQVFYPRLKARIDRKLGCFVPVETLVDARIDPWGFDRVVPRTTAKLRYDKFNQLRMSVKGDTHTIKGELDLNNYFTTRTDRIAVACEKFSVSANPDHFAGIYNVVTDLLLCSDPKQKRRSKKLEDVVFTHDFNNLEEAADIVARLQYRLRNLADICQQFQIHLDNLDNDNRMELYRNTAEFIYFSNELNLVVRAITLAQNYNGSSKSYRDVNAGVQFEGRATELVWHMIDKSDTPFVKLSVNGVEFSWMSKQDSSVSNRLIIQDLKALNSSPEPVFAEIIAKYNQPIEQKVKKKDFFATVLWNTLPSVGGISIIENFELHLHPVRLQLEHRVGHQIMNYLFSERRKHSEEMSILEETEGNVYLHQNLHQRYPSILSENYTNMSTDSLVSDGNNVIHCKHI